MARGVTRLRGQVWHNLSTDHCSDLLILRPGRGPVPGVGLQGLQADEEGDGQVSVSAAVLQE